MIPSPNQLKGSSTSSIGIATIIAGLVSLWTQISGMIHGKPVDITAMSVTISGISSGIGLLHSADAKQGDKL